ncbi:MAG: DUF1801 domain-containing protein [Phycisphaerales bacterium]|nr:DUF1801 domain-containing protein [Phycisphaerales bacterium]MCB9835232.1 DUF1801 domain-containing protein [Phycisphaera sp.]
MKKSAFAKSRTTDPTASQEIDAQLAALGGWRSETLSRIRALIHEADPEVVEEVKWRKPTNPAGMPCWSHGGLICTGETYKDKIKLTFPKGAQLEDKAGLFNSSLEGNARRAIDLFEGDTLNARSFKALIKAAVALNTKAKPAAKPKPKPKATASRSKAKKSPKKG